MGKTLGTLAEYVSRQGNLLLYTKGDGGEALGTNAARSTREWMEAKCKEEGEIRGPRDPALRALGRADTLT